MSGDRGATAEGRGRRGQTRAKTEEQPDTDEPAPAVDKDVEAYAARKIRKVTADDIGRAGKASSGYLVVWVWGHHMLPLALRTPYSAFICVDATRPM